MSKRHSYLSIALGLSLISTVFGDEGHQEVAALDVSAIEPVEIPMSSPPEAPAVAPVIPVAPVAHQRPFSPFTGKVKGKKVRLRANADIESQVVRELDKHELLVVTGEKGDFYVVEPPAGTKAYVFRSFVLDGVVEGNRVNVRLKPSLDAPVIGHLQSGDHIKGSISSLNNKWYEISPPAGTRFYVAKEYLQSIGGPEVKTQLDKRRSAGEQLLDAAQLLTQVEMKKSYREMDVDRIKQHYQTVMNDYTDFPDLVEKAKEAFNALHEEITARKISFLEDKSDGKASSHEKADADVEIALNATDRMKMWEPVEESLFLAWSSRHEDRSMDEFYEAEKQNAQTITGIVEPYTAPVKRKPGDYVVKNGDIPVAYVYSTHINLNDYVGKKVTFQVTPRSNNNFAFQAFFVLSVE